MQKRRTRGRAAILALTIFGGTGPLLVALWITDGRIGEWSSGVLVNLGASVLLVVPLYLVTRRLDDRIERARIEASSSAEALREQVSILDKKIEERRLEDVVESVSRRLEDLKKEEVAVFDAMRDTPSYKTVSEALARALETGLTSETRGPRVKISAGLFARIEYHPELSDRGIVILVEYSNGLVLYEVNWPPTQDVEEVMVELACTLDRRTSSWCPLDVESLFRNFHEALIVAHSSQSRRPIWQLVAPQWVITEGHLAAYGDSYNFTVAINDLKDDPGLLRHILNKPWVDWGSFEEAHLVAFELHGIEPI